MAENTPLVVLCNGATLTKKLARAEHKEVLSYGRGREQNLKISLPNFVNSVYHLPKRVLDLLEIAAYVFGADRLQTRGRKDDLEYHRWARNFHFVIKVRDFDFWNDPSNCQKLGAALGFMSGDSAYEFSFQPGHSTPAVGLFDKEEFKFGGKDARIILFSGGVDSLTGTLDSLHTSKEEICLVSHQSQPSMIRTQSQLVQKLSELYAKRLSHYRFHCTLKNVRAEEETQRTRAFLYTSIAVALAHAFSQQRVFVYENGMTAINWPRRQDLMNARASRTTHPQTIALLQDFFSAFSDRPFTIETPYLWQTKTDVFCKLSELGGDDLITSTVSCSRTFQRLGQATHCGGCSQCVDRRFAAYAAELEDIDNAGIYANDFIQQMIEEGTVKTTVLDYVRQAKNFARWNIDHFYREMINELAQVIDYLPGMDQGTGNEEVWQLCQRHGRQVENAIKRMRDDHDKVYDSLVSGSFLQLVANREHLKEPIDLLVDAICTRVSVGIPSAFRRVPPVDEHDFNDKVSAILNSEELQLTREHPSISFALAHTVPDHATKNLDLFIESKYIRGGTTPSRVTDGIAADLTKYSDGSFILFLLYDPERAIHDDKTFRRDFETKGRGRCRIHIVR